MIGTLITGSRNWRDRDRLWRDLDSVYVRGEPFHLFVGDCPTGADLFARQWFEAKFGPELVTVQHPHRFLERKIDAIGNALHVYLAERGPDGKWVGPWAGPERNKRMASEARQYDIYRGFGYWDGKLKGSGTLGCSAECVALGIGMIIRATPIV